MAAVKALTITLRFVPVDIVGEQPEVVAMQYWYSVAFVEAPHERVTGTL